MQTAPPNDAGRAEKNSNPWSFNSNAISASLLTGTPASASIKGGSISTLFKCFVIITGRLIPYDDNKRLEPLPIITGLSKFDNKRTNSSLVDGK